MVAYDEKTGSARKYDQVDLVRSNKRLASHRYNTADIKAAARGMQLLVADDYQLARDG